MIKAYIGLDVSMNSTGLTLHIPEQNITKLFLITPDVVISSNSVQLVTYKRDWRKSNYSEAEMCKVKSSMILASRIKTIIGRFADTYNVDDFEARIEGNIMQSFKQKASRVNDLVLFNATIKIMLFQHPQISRIAVVAPTALKKIATGKGNCKKPEVVKAFINKFPKFHVAGKIDDIADSYWLAAGTIKEGSCFIK